MAPGAVWAQIKKHVIFDFLIMTFMIGYIEGLWKIFDFCDQHMCFSFMDCEPDKNNWSLSMALKTFILKSEVHFDTTNI